MICDVCGAAEREAKLIRYTLDLDGTLVVVDHVPANVCPNCGEVSLAPATVDALQRTVWDRQAPSRTMEAAVYEFSAR